MLYLSYSVAVAGPELNYNIIIIITDQNTRKGVRGTTS